MGGARDSAPQGLRRVLEDLVFALEEEALSTLAGLLDIATPSGLWGRDGGEWMRRQVERIGDAQVYDFIERLLAGDDGYDDQVNKILRGADSALAMVDGSFFEDDLVAEELDVHDAEADPIAVLKGKYAPALVNWKKALAALKASDEKQAVALAVNTLEGVVRIASGAKGINDGLKKLFPEGERQPLCAAINQLHTYGSAMPWVRHGGGTKDLDLARIEARGVIRAAAVWIVMLVNSDQEGRF